MHVNTEQYLFSTKALQHHQAISIYVSIYLATPQMAALLSLPPMTSQRTLTSLCIPDILHCVAVLLQNGNTQIDHLAVLFCILSKMLCWHAQQPESMPGAKASNSAALHGC